jgi:hypothetical protein
VTELPYHGQPADTDRICYRVKCPSPIGQAPNQTVTDRFGTHGLKNLKTQMVCTPASGGTLVPPPSGFQIKSPEIEIAPGQDVAFCYYFRTPNAVTVPVKRWTSQMNPVTQEVIMFTTTDSQGEPIDRLPPGVVSAADCGVLPSGQVIPRWAYEARTPTAELAMPADDGAGHPLAMEIPPLSSGFLLIHSVNNTNQVMKAQVTVDAEFLDSPVYTRTDTYMTSIYNISIPPFAIGDVESKMCNVPAGLQFWRLTMDAHKRAARLNVLDATNVLFESFDWSNPGAQTWPTPPFLTFASNRLTYACTYNNQTNRTITTGDSYQSDEQCVAVGYFFPATKPLWCQNGAGPF